MTRKTRVRIQVAFAPAEKFVLTTLCKKIDRAASQGVKHFPWPVFPEHRTEDNSTDSLTVTLTRMVL